MYKIIKNINLFLIISISVLFSAESEFLLSADQHVKFIKSSLEQAEKRVVIISPFISSHRLEDREFNAYDGLAKYIKAAISRGISIDVYTDAGFDENKPAANSGRRTLKDLGVKLKVVKKIHTKNIIIDNSCITFGSFNWLSSDINPEGLYYHWDTTTIVRNERAKEPISKVMEHLITLELDQIELTSLRLDEGEEELLECAVRLNQECPQCRNRAENIIYNSKIYYLEDNGFDFLRNIQDKTGVENLIDLLVQRLSYYTSNASEYVELAEVLVKIGEKEKAVKIAKRILSCDRGKEYDNMDFIYDHLCSIGFNKLAEAFELYIYGHGYLDDSGKFRVRK